MCKINSFDIMQTKRVYFYLILCFNVDAKQIEDEGCHIWK